MQKRQALLPAVYFQNGVRIPEPAEAGLFVKITNDGICTYRQWNDESFKRYIVQGEK